MSANTHVLAPGNSYLDLRAPWHRKNTGYISRKIAIHVPFSVYLGWITIASIANVSVTLVSINWNGFGIDSQIWATLVILVALLITLAVIATRRDVAYGLVIIWALAGIAVKQSGNQTIAILTEASAVIVFLALVTVVVLNKFRRRRQISQT